MYMYMYMCMYMYVYVYVYVYMLHMYVRVHVHMYDTSALPCICTYVCAHICADMCIHKYKYIFFELGIDQSATAYMAIFHIICTLIYISDLESFCEGLNLLFSVKMTYK